MNSTAGRVALGIVFVALLATPLVLKRVWYADKASAKSAADESLRRNGFHLDEVSLAAGVAFTHSAPTLDPKLAHIMPQVASMGAGVAVVDVDRDGWPDLYVTNSGEGSKNCLFRNNGD